MKKNIFYFTPSLINESNAAAVRNYWLHKVLNDHCQKIKLISNKDFIFKLPNNNQSTFTRLLKETFSGINLFFKVLFNKSDIYFFSSPPYITIMIGIIACWLKNKKYILDIRDVYPEVLFDLGVVQPNSIIGKILSSLTSKAYNKAYKIITVTEGFKLVIEKYTDNKVELIYNGYDPELFKPSHEKFEKFTVVFHGNLGKFQRIDLLVEVAKVMEQTHPEIQFKIIGSGPGEKYLHNPPGNLEYLGKMPYQDIGKFIAKCHLGISLRTDDEISKEAFPVKVFEFIGVGIPVIVSPPGEASKFVEKNNLGFTTTNDPQEIKERIMNVYSNQSFNKDTSGTFSRHNQSLKLLKIL